MATAQTAAKPASKGDKQLWLWEAKTKAGEVKKGEMEAGDATAVDARLKSLGLTPTKVKKKGSLDMNIRCPA